MATAGVFLLSDYAGQVANTFDNMPIQGENRKPSPEGELNLAPKMSVMCNNLGDDVVINSEIPESRAEEAGGNMPSYSSSMLWRCLDGEHPMVCERCLPPPALDEEANYELVGDPGKKNGEKKLRSLLQKTVEWADANCRQEAADAAVRDGKPEFAKTIIKKDVPGLRKGHFFYLMRHWGFKSDVWKLKQTIVNAQKAREARAEQDRQLQAHMLSIQMEKTGLQFPGNIPSGDLAYDDADDFKEIDEKMIMDDDDDEEGIDDMFGEDVRKTECESSIESAAQTLYYDSSMLMNIDQRKVEDEVINACDFKDWSDHSLEHDEAGGNKAMMCGQADSPGCCSSCPASDIPAPSFRDELLPLMEDVQLNPIVKSSWTTIRFFINEKLSKYGNLFISSGAQNKEYLKVSNICWSVRKDYNISCAEELKNKVLRTALLQSTLKMMRRNNAEYLMELSGPLFESKLTCPVTPLLDNMSECFHYLMIKDGRAMQMKALMDLGHSEIVGRTNAICQAFMQDPNIQVPKDSLAYFHTIGAMNGKRMLAYARSLLAWSKTQPLETYFTTALALQEFFLSLFISFYTLVTSRIHLPVDVMSGPPPDAVMQILGDTIVPR